MNVACIDYKQTGFFSQTVIDYIDDAPGLRAFYNYRPDLEGFAALLKSKKAIADRGLLVKLLTEQYGPILQAGVHNAKEVSGNIALLQEENSYTITTGHQLNIFAGPLYFVFKICTAIKLSRQLKAAFPIKTLCRFTGWRLKTMILQR